MPSGVVTSSHLDDDYWYPREKDLKRYIHFDRHIPAAELKRLANDPKQVSRNNFFPLLRFFEEWTKFRKKGVRKPPKRRPLRFSCRKDAAIFARYRVKLSSLYEKELARRGIAHVPVAYRKIPKQEGGNKSNIEISKEVFDYIKETKNCIATVVDIKSYFESIDHSKIFDAWKMLIGGSLPPDHLAVFKAITGYSIVDVDKLFSRLELNKVGVGNNRAERRKREIDRIRVRKHLQICSPSEFRKRVAGSDPCFPSLIQKNTFDFGIPQGTPISDLVANFYLIDFDEEINRWVSERGGIYRRYSDDIIIVLPRETSLDEYIAKDHLQLRIKQYGKNLRIQNKKVSIVRFEENADRIEFSHIFGAASRNGLEYLGFEFDGRKLRIRSSTLSNAWRKLKRRAYGYARRFVRRYRAKGKLWLHANFPYKWLQKELLKKVTYSQNTSYEKWTFVSYVRRAKRQFSDYETQFSQQTKRYRHFADVVILQAFNKALEFHS